MNAGTATETISPETELGFAEHQRIALAIRDVAETVGAGDFEDPLPQHEAAVVFIDTFELVLSTVFCINCDFGILIGGVILIIFFKFFEC